MTMALNSPRSRRVLHGAERDSTDIFTRKLRVITSRAGAPVRRCPGGQDG